MGSESEPADETLALRAAAGDETAFAALVRRWAAPLYKFLWRYHPDPADSDDLFQETWVGVLGGIRRFDPGRRFSTWLFQIALNRCRDLARRRRTRASHLAQADDGAGGRDMGATAAMEGRAEVAVVMKAIETLPEAQKEVLLLRYYSGLSEAEVSEVVGCPRGTVKSRLHEALGRLRRDLDPRSTGE